METWETSLLGRWPAAGQGVACARAHFLMWWEEAELGTQKDRKGGIATGSLMWLSNCKQQEGCGLLADLYFITSWQYQLKWTALQRGRRMPCTLVGQNVPRVWSTLPARDTEWYLCDKAQGVIQLCMQGHDLYWCPETFVSKESRTRNDDFFWCNCTVTRA